MINFFIVKSKDDEKLLDFFDQNNLAYYQLTEAQWTKLKLLLNSEKINNQAETNA